ncbi:MAG: hypothetical protein ACREOJ_18875 [Gemmatimonadaceae bacterium]
MSGLLDPRHLATAHLVMCAVILLWNLFTAARTSAIRSIPQPVAVVSAFAGLLLLPALVALLVTDSTVTGSVLYSIAWLWPVTVALITAQTVLSARFKLASPAVTFFIAAYDVLVTLIAVSRYWMSVSDAVPTALVALVAAERGAIAFSAQPLALLMPWFLYVPIFAPVSPGRAGSGAAFRTLLATVAAAWTALVVMNLPAGARAVTSYTRYASERLQERPDSDFVVGLKILPVITGAPQATVLRNDLALTDSVGAGALSVYVAPAGVTNLALDSLARALDEARGDKVLIVSLDLSGAAPLPAAARTRYFRSRVANVVRIANQLRPDYVVPVVDPAGAASRALGGVPTNVWIDYLRDAANAVHRAQPSVHVMAHVGGFGARDSSIFAWAASGSSPVDAAAISLFPWLGGAAALDARTRTATGWLRADRTEKPVWVLAAGGFPLAQGGLSQARAIWGALAWATSQQAVKGLIVYEASDYAEPLGLRSAGGRVRTAALTVRQTVRALGE